MEVWSAGRALVAAPRHADASRRTLGGRPGRRKSWLGSVTNKSATTVTGVGASLPLVMTREPVTTISAIDSSAAAGVSCACVDIAANVQVPAAVSTAFNLVDRMAHPPISLAI